MDKTWKSYRMKLVPATALPATGPISKCWCGHQYFFPHVLLQAIRNVDVFIPRAFRKPSTLVVLLSKKMLFFTARVDAWKEPFQLLSKLLLREPILPALNCLFLSKIMLFFWLRGIVFLLVSFGCCTDYWCVLFCSDIPSPQPHPIQSPQTDPHPTPAHPPHPILAGWKLHVLVPQAWKLSKMLTCLSKSWCV